VLMSARLLRQGAWRTARSRLVDEMRASYYARSALLFSARAMPSSSV
jgi:hypothetical protein